MAGLACNQITALRREKNALGEEVSSLQQEVNKERQSHLATVQSLSSFQGKRDQSERCGTVLTSAVL